MATKAKPAKTKPAAGEVYDPATDIKLIHPSKTNPRRRIDDKTLRELAANIAEVGILEPLLIRKNSKGFELICGERRWRAAQIAKLKTVPTIVKDLSDEQVLEVQIHENLHREDVHPMDEAYGYKFLKEKLGCDDKELALRVGKSEGYVLNRLKLNELIEKAQKDIDDEFLPLSYALEIAKYSPEAQELIYENALYEREWNRNYTKRETNKGKLFPFPQMKAWIQTNVLWSLAKAPFDLKATNLRPDGLACVGCPQRTGAAASLFDIDDVAKNDSCLNPDCYRGKARQLVQLTRTSIADSEGKPLEQVPVVKPGHYSDGEGYLGTASFVVISKKKPKAPVCNSSIGAVSIEDGSVGKIVDVCLKSSGCKTHWAPSSSSSSSSSRSSSGGSSEAERRKQLNRKEEIFDVKIGEVVRRQVFREAAEKFAKSFKISGGQTNFLPQLIARMWKREESNEEHKVIVPIIRDWIGGKEVKTYFSEEHQLVDYVNTAFAVDIQARILFLFVHASKGGMYYGSWTSQKGVKAIAEEFGINYRLLDAQERHNQCPKKHKKVHLEYLQAVERGDAKASIPRVYSTGYKAD